MKAVLLIRVSTEGQDYEAQKNELIEYATYKGYTEYVIITDKESGIKLSEEERCGINDMKKAIESDNSINAIFIWEISRLARTQKVLYSVRDYLITKKINMFIKDKNYQLLNSDGTVNPDTDILFTLYAYFAESEMKLKKERFARGRNEGRKKGKFIGGANIPFGYKIDENNYILINDKIIDSVGYSPADLIKMAFNKYTTENISIKQLSDYFKALGLKDKLANAYTLTNILKNKSYIGQGYYNIEQLIPEELFNKVTALMKTKSKKTDKSSKNTFLLRNILKCGYCKHDYTGNFLNNHYVCSEYNEWGEHKRTCFDGTTISLRLIEGIIWDMVKGFASSFELSSNELNYTNQINELTKQIENIKLISLDMENEMNKLNKMFQKDRISEEKYDSEYKVLEKELKKHTNKITSSESEIIMYKNYIKESSSITDRMLNLNEITDRTVMKKIINKYIKDVYLYSNKTMSNKRIITVNVKWGWQSNDVYTILFNTNKRKHEYKTLKFNTSYNADKDMFEYDKYISESEDGCALFETYELSFNEVYNKDDLGKMNSYEPIQYEFIESIKRKTELQNEKRRLKVLNMTEEERKERSKRLHDDYIRRKNENNQSNI